MKTAPDDLAIPAFLKVSAAERAAAWVANPPRAMPTFEQPKAVKPDPTVVAIQETAEQIRRNRTTARIGRMMANVATNDIPAHHRVWDRNRSRWIDARIVPPHRIATVSARTGIPLERVCQYLNQERNMPKLNILVYRADETEPASRGRTSIDSEAAESEIHQKIVGAMLRTGINKVHHVDVVDPDGKTETWNVDLSGENLVSLLSAASIKLSGDKMPTKKSSTKVKTKTKPKAKKPAKVKAKVKAKKTNGATNPKAKHAPGEVRKGSKMEIIQNLLLRKSGCTMPEVLAAIEWPTISMPQRAKELGLKLRKEKVSGKVTRYFGS